MNCVRLNDNNYAHGIKMDSKKRCSFQKYIYLVAGVMVLNVYLSIILTYSILFLQRCYGFTRSFIFIP